MKHAQPPRLRAALATREAVRACFADLPVRETVVVGLSGGADSLALTAACAHEAKEAGLLVAAAVIDHGLQDESAEIAARAAAQARGIGIETVRVRRVEVQDRGGPEAAARDARYGALHELALELRAHAVLTAHTRDDQAEQVLLGLARGSGLRALAGIPPRREFGEFPGTSDRGPVLLIRPFLCERPEITRGVTERACAELGIDPWYDPHNADPAYARARARASVLPVLEEQLGPGVSAALARTADLAREDAEALDLLASRAVTQFREDPEALCIEGAWEIPIDRLTALPSALRNRVIRQFAREISGAPLTLDRTRAIATLLTDWRGQARIEAPGVWVSRTGNTLRFLRP